MRIQAPRGEIVDRNGVRARRQPAGQRRADRAAGAARADDHRRGELGPGGRPAQRKRPKGRGPAGPAAADRRPPSCAQRYRRLGRVLGMRADDDPPAGHRAARRAALLGGDRPLGRAQRGARLHQGAPGGRSPASTSSAVFLRDYPRGDARRPAARHRRRDQPERAQAAAQPRRQAGHDHRQGGPRVHVRPLPARPRRRQGPARRRATASFAGELRERREPGARPPAAAVARPRPAEGRPGGHARRSAAGCPGALRRDEPAQRRRSTRWARCRASTRAVFAKPISQSKLRAADLRGERRAAASTARSPAAIPSARRSSRSPRWRRSSKGVVTPDTVDQRLGLHQDRHPRGVQRRQERRTAPVALRRALQVSSDVYFYNAGRRPLRRRAASRCRSGRALGLGRRTGIDLPGEQRGTIPGREWRAEINEAEDASAARRTRCRAVLRRRRSGRTTSATTSNLAVGQGEMRGEPAADGRRLRDASPTAAACRARTSASRSRTHRPPRSSGSTRARARKVKIDPRWRQAIMDGLARGGAAPSGGTSADVFAGWPHGRLPVFGKTGTAESSSTGAPYDQSWYVAYVPHPSKPIVVAATVERGGFGADRAAPFVRRLLAKWFDLAGEARRPRRRATRQAPTDGDGSPILDPSRGAASRRRAARRAGCCGSTRSCCWPCSASRVCSLVAIDATTRIRAWPPRQAVYFGVGLVAGARHQPGRLLAAARAQVRPVRADDRARSSPCSRSAT